MDLIKANQRGASTGTQKSVDGTPQGQTLDLRDLRSARNQTPTPAAKAQREEFQNRIHPGRVRDSAQQQTRNNRTGSRQESREERTARKEREAQVRVRQQKTQQDAAARAQELQSQREVTDNLVDERALATNKSAQLSDRGSRSTESVEAGRVDLETETAREGAREKGSLAKLGVDPQAHTDSTQSDGLTAGAATEIAQPLDLRQVVHVFANRSFAHTAWYHQVMSFFANVEPVDLDEREREELLSEIENLTAAELTPEKLIKLIMLGSICKEALNRVQDKVRELGDKAPATAEEIGALMLKGIELWKKADEVAFDPRNN